jgi:hypothetical protein
LRKDYGVEVENFMDIIYWNNGTQAAQYGTLLEQKMGSLLGDKIGCTGKGRPLDFIGKT